MSACSTPQEFHAQNWEGSKMSEDEELPLPTRKNIDAAADALVEPVDSVKVLNEEQDPEEILPSIY